MTHKVFLSHHSDDKPMVERLAERLEAAGVEVWFDKWNLIPGDLWQPELEKALKDCDTCAVFIGGNALGPWHNEEMQVVLDRRTRDKTFRVIPVLLPPGRRGKRGEVPLFLANAVWVEFRRSLDEETAFDQLLRGIRRQSPRRRNVSLQQTDGPYRGLRTFDVADAGNFYGREALTDWLVAGVRRMLQSERETRFLAIVGASGSGKSSVARAGLLHELMQGAIEGSDRWLTITIDHPGADPVTELATRGAEVLCLPDDALMLKERFIDPVGSNPEHKNLLHIQANLALHKQQRPCLLVFVDQFEEIFTACEDAQLRRRFVDLLLHAARVPGGKVLVVITIRMDFLSKCVDLPKLDGMLSGGMELVGAMSDDELEAAIRCPAENAGVAISESLVQTLIKAVRAQPGSLPLLEHVLAELWKLKENGRITDEHYIHGVGGIEGALARRANAILEGYGGKAQRDATLSLLTRLVHISDPAAPETDTRARYRIGDVDYFRLKPFVDAHLLITTRDGAANGGRIIEVAHEALIRDWPELREALKDKREFLVWRQTIQADLKRWSDVHQTAVPADKGPINFLEGRDLKQARRWIRQTWCERRRFTWNEWFRSKKTPYALLDGQRLADARRWLKVRRSDFAPDELAFIQHSLRHARCRIMRSLALTLLLLLSGARFLWWIEDNHISPRAGWYIGLAKTGIYTLQPEMVPIPRDRDCSQQICQFLMGASKSDPNAGREQPQHSVRFYKSFWMGSYEVTFDEYQVFAYLIESDGGCEDHHRISAISDSGWGRGQKPVINVTWKDAQCYVKWLSRKTEKPYRLPTESEWEFAARADTSSRNWWGSEVNDKNIVCSSCTWPGKINKINTTEVTNYAFKPNRWKLYHTAGNVWEWTADCWHPNYNGAPPDSHAWEASNDGDCEYRVIRGGSWEEEPSLMSSALRDYASLDMRTNRIGFRIAKDY